MIYFSQLSKQKSLNYQIPSGIRRCYCGIMRDGDESVPIWKKKDRVFHLCRERMRGQRNPCRSTMVWNFLPQHHKNHCSQCYQWTIWNICHFLNSPLHRQVCSSSGGGLQVSHHLHLHSWAKGHPRRRKNSCRSRRRYLLGRKDPLQSALCP